MAKHFFQLMKKLLFSKGFLPAEKDFEQSRPLNTANFLGYSMKVARCSKKARRNKKNTPMIGSKNEERRKTATLIVH